jgi:hypothetical protein
MDTKTSGLFDPNDIKLHLLPTAVGCGVELYRFSPLQCFHHFTVCPRIRYRLNAHAQNCAISVNEIGLLEITVLAYVTVA